MAGIETLKDRYTSDDRYTFTEEYFDCPSIWVFSNTMFDMQYMSLNKLKVWEISSTNELKES